MKKVTIDPFKVIGIAARTSNENNMALSDIGQLWGKFMSENVVERIPNKVNDVKYSMYTGYDGDHTDPYTAIICCRVTTLDDIPEGMVGLNINGGKYTKSTARGAIQDGFIAKEWEAIIEKNLDRTFIADFEVFGEKAQNPNDAEVEFFVGINN